MTIANIVLYIGLLLWTIQLQQLIVGE